MTFSMWMRPSWTASMGKETRREIQTSYLSNNDPGLPIAAKEKLVKYERTWIPEQAFIQAHEGLRVTERSPDPSERGTQQFRFARG
ncbi:hypothetical protein ABIB83_004710 [Bradyrhizobium sp. I1.8.5]